MTVENRLSEKIEWSNSIPVFRNPIILKQMGIAIVIPFGLMIAIIFAVTKASREALYLAGLVAVLFLLTYLFLMVVWGGKYQVGFVLDAKGVRCFTQEVQRRKNCVINVLTVVLGLLSAKPAVAGAGILAQARQDVIVKWKNIRKVRYIPRQYVIMVKGGFSENIAIFCTAENYMEVEVYVKKMIINKRKNA